MTTTHADPSTGVEAAADKGAGKIICNACPVLCNISEGRSGACDRYANLQGVLTRLDPLVLVQRAQAGEQGLVRPIGQCSASIRQHLFLRPVAHPSMRNRHDVSLTAIP